MHKYTFPPPNFQNFCLCLLHLHASAMPIIVTLTYLFWKGAEINWLFGLWALVNMILFHIAGNVWSDYHDFVKKVDREAAPGGRTRLGTCIQVLP